MRHLAGWLRWLLLVVGAGLLGTTAPAWAEERLEPVTLQLRWLHQFQFAGYYAAQAQGFYAEAGLEVRLAELPPGRETVDVVLSGEAEYGVGSSDLVLHRVGGAPVVALAVVFQHSPLVILARRPPGADQHA